MTNLQVDETSCNRCEPSDSAARYAVKRVGLQARKTRWRANTVDNRGGFQILDPMRNLIMAGEKFDLAADDVIALCADYAK
jgi:hypothetical protein